MGIDLGIEFQRMRNGPEEEQEIKVDFKQKGKEWRQEHDGVFTLCHNECNN